MAATAMSDSMPQTAQKSQRGKKKSRRKATPIEEIVPGHPKYRTCVACGDQITKHLFPSRLAKPMLWCSFSCYKWKPPKVIWIELKFGKTYRIDIRWVLIETTKRFDNLQAQCFALDVSIPYLYTMVKRYFGMPLPQFVAKHSTGERKIRYRKAAQRKRVGRKKRTLKTAEAAKQIAAA